MQCTPEICRTAMNLTMLGLTKDEVCERFDISGGVYDRWMKTESLFRTAIQTAKNIDGDAVAGLHRRATGCQVFEEKAFFDPRTGQIKKVKCFKEIPPSEVACMMLLTNRQGDRWRWRQQVDHTNSDGSFAMFTDALRAKHSTYEGEFRAVDETAQITGPMRT